MLDILTRNWTKVDLLKSEDDIFKYRYPFRFLDIFRYYEMFWSIVLFLINILPTAISDEESQWLWEMLNKTLSFG